MANHNYYSDIDDVRLNLMDAVSETAITDAVMVRGALNVYNLINAKLCKRYNIVAFPLSTTGNTPGIITEISDTLTACWARKHTAGLNTRSRGPTADECKQALEMIDKLAAGDMKIPGYSSALPSSNTEGEHGVFGKVGVHEWGQDADQADRISDERD